MRPNLFNFATKELSQDAFIAWLLQWASPECQQLDAHLSECAKIFATKLLSLQIEPPSEITMIKVERQWKNIDVCAEINGKYLLIIEDKIFAGQHSNQLQRYKEDATSWCAKNGFQLVCVYLKTGSESECFLKEAEKQGFAVFRRRDFLDILQPALVNNHIFIDFKERLEAMERAENEFTQKSIKDWSGSDWVGFYQALEKARPVVKWEYVNNPSEGFWNAILNWQEIKESKDCYPLFMQIEQGQLCFKIGEVYENRSEIRDRYRAILMSYLGKSEIRKPDRLGSGTYMTIAVVDPANWLGDDDSFVDLSKVVARLNEYESLFYKMIQKIKSENSGPV